MVEVAHTDSLIAIGPFPVPDDWDPHTACCAGLSPCPRQHDGAGGATAILQLSPALSRLSLSPGPSPGLSTGLSPTLSPALSTTRGPSFGGGTLPAGRTPRAGGAAAPNGTGNTRTSLSPSAAVHDDAAGRGNGSWDTALPDLQLFGQQLLPASSTATDAAVTSSDAGDAAATVSAVQSVLYWQRLLPPRTRPDVANAAAELVAALRADARRVVPAAEQKGVLPALLHAAKLHSTEAHNPAVYARQLAATYVLHTDHGLNRPWMLASPRDSRTLRALPASFAKVCLALDLAGSRQKVRDALRSACGIAKCRGHWKGARAGDSPQYDRAKERGFFFFTDGR